MDQIKMPQVFGDSSQELKESILTDVRAKFKTLAQHFHPTLPTDYLPPKKAEIPKASLCKYLIGKKKILNPLRLG